MKVLRPGNQPRPRVHTCTCCDAMIEVEQSDCTPGIAVNGYGMPIDVAETNCPECGDKLQFTIEWFYETKKDVESRLADDMGLNPCLEIEEPTYGQRDPG